MINKRALTLTTVLTLFVAYIGFGEQMMDKKYFIDQLRERSEHLGMGLSEEILEKVITITQWFSAEGNWCADSGMLGFDEMKANWEAIEDATVMIFDVKQMKELIMSDEQLKNLWIEVLESGMRYKVYRENGFLIENATERYLSFRKRYPGLSDRVPLRYIATYLGITPESLSRIRSAMKEKTTE